MSGRFTSGLLLVIIAVTLIAQVTEGHALTRLKVIGS